MAMIGQDQINCEESWSVPAWFVDPVAGNDAATGTTALAPLKHYSELVRRWGTIAPLLTQNTTIEFLSDQTATSDPVAFLGQAGADGASQGVLMIKGQLVAQLPSSTITTLTAQNRATGQKWQIRDTSLPTENFWATYVGFLVHDTTADAWFWIDSNLGNKTATISEPLQSATGGNSAPARVAIANGDSYIIYAPTRVNLVRNAGRAASGYTCNVQHIDCTFDAGGETVLDSFLNLIECKFGNFVEGSKDAASTYSNCFIQGGINTSGAILGGVINAELAVTGQLVLDGDVLVNAGPISIIDDLIVGAAYFANTVDVPNLTSLGANVGSLFISNNAFYGLAAIWGPAAINAHVGGDLGYLGTAVGAFLNAGGLTLDGVAIASSYDLTTGIWTPGIAVTPAKLDQAVGGILGGFGGAAYGNKGTKIRAIA